MGQIADIDRGALQLRHDSVSVADILRGIRPVLQSDAERAESVLLFDLAPGPARVHGDRVRLQEAIASILRAAIRRSVPGSRNTIELRQDAGEIVIIAGDLALPTLDVDVAFAQRVIAAHGGVVEQRPARLCIVLRAG